MLTAESSQERPNLDVRIGSDPETGHFGDQPPVVIDCVIRFTSRTTDHHYNFVMLRRKAACAGTLFV